MTDWVLCPHCGEKIARNAVACRHCGSDENTGWSQGTYMDGINLPEEGEYEDGLEREGFGKPKPNSKSIFLAAVSLLLAFLFAAWLLQGLFNP